MTARIAAWAVVRAHDVDTSLHKERALAEASVVWRPGIVVGLIREDVVNEIVRAAVDAAVREVKALNGNNGK